MCSASPFFETSLQIEVDVLRTRLVKGEFDNQIVDITQPISRELKLLIRRANRDFLFHLFVSDLPKETLSHWLTQGVSLPTDAVALAIIFQSNQHVFHMLKERGYFAKISAPLSREEEREILARAHGNQTVLERFKACLETRDLSSKPTP